RISPAARQIHDEICDPGKSNGTDGIVRDQHCRAGSEVRAAKGEFGGCVESEAAGEAKEQSPGARWFGDRAERDARVRFEPAPGFLLRSLRSGETGSDPDECRVLPRGRESLRNTARGSG